MTSTNDGKDVKSNQTSGHKGKIYYIELYKSLDRRLSADTTGSERTTAVCEAWRRVHSLCQHSAPNTHPLLLAWLQRHTSFTILQNDWPKAADTSQSKEQHKWLEEAIDAFITECREAKVLRNGVSPPWESQLLQRALWFKSTLSDPWSHPVLRTLLKSQENQLTDEEVLEWLKQERGITFVTRLKQLAASRRCRELALRLAGAVMARARAAVPLVPDVDQATESPRTESSFMNMLQREAGFKGEVWNLITDIEFVLLHSESQSKCIELAKQTPLSNCYNLVDRLQNRLETSPRDKKIWKNAKEVATLIAQVVIARCMVIPTCTGVAALALYRNAKALVRLLPAQQLPAAAAALAAPAPTAQHLHMLAVAVHAQCKDERKSFVCELYVRAITAGMNELERLKLKTEKQAEARCTEQTLSKWFSLLGSLLSASARLNYECLLTAFSVHPSQEMFHQVRNAPTMEPLHKDTQESKPETNSEFGSWANDSRTQTNLVKTSETLNMKSQKQANVLSTAIFAEGEALGLDADLCQDLAVLISGPRVKTLTWDMERESLLENCRTYMERTHSGTRALTTELKYLNLDPRSFQHLPEEDDEENDAYYGIEKGYEHLVERAEDNWEDEFVYEVEQTDVSHSAGDSATDVPKRKKKSKLTPNSSDEEVDPLDLDDMKRSEKQERFHSKERRKEKHKVKEGTLKSTDESKEHSQEKTKEIRKKEKKKERKERKKKDKMAAVEVPTSGSTQNSKGLSRLIGMKVAKQNDRLNLIDTDSDYDSQGKSSVNSEGNDPNVLFDGLFSMDEIKSPERGMPASFQRSTHSLGTGNNVGLNNSTPNLSGGLSKSQPIVNRSNAPNQANNMVKKSIKKLLEFRRNKNSNTNTASKIIKPAIPCSNNLKLSPLVSNIQKSNSNEKWKLSLVSTSDNNDFVKSYSHHGNVADNKKVVAEPVEGLLPTTNTSQKANYNVTEGKKSFQYAPYPIKKVSPPTIKQTITTSDINRSNSRPFKPSMSAESSSQNQYKEFLKQKSSVVIKKQPTKSCSDTLNQIQFQEFLKEQSSFHANSVDRLQGASRQYQTKNAQNGSRQSLSNSNTPSQVHHQNFLKELRESANAGTSKNTSGTNSLHITKSVPKQQKKADNAPNTFSRRNYLHKTKLNDNKIKLNPNQAQPGLSISMEEMHNLGVDYNKVSNLQTKGDIVISRLDVKGKESNVCHKTVLSKVDNSNSLSQRTSSVLKQHPIMSHILSSNETYGSKLPSENKNTLQKHITVPNSNLSEKDQNDLLLLLRQQSKMNVKPTLKTEIENTSTCSNLKVSNIDTDICNSNLSISCQSLNTNLLNQKAIIQAVKTSVIKSNENLSITASEPKKSRNVKGNIKNPKQSSNNGNPTSDWESVMNALLAHKTPSRGPNALDVALKKDSFEKRQSNDTKTMTQCPASSAKSERTLLKNSATKLSSSNTSSLPKKQNVQDFKPRSEKNSTKLVNTKVNQIDLAKRSAIKKCEKHIPSVIQNGNDPFISGIPNSDFDLLGDLMDDDLRQEIGELLADDEAYGMSTISTKNKNMPSDLYFDANKTSTSVRKPQLIIDGRQTKNPRGSIISSCSSNHKEDLSIKSSNIEPTKSTCASALNQNSKLRIISNELVTPPILAKKSNTEICNSIHLNNVAIDRNANDDNPMVVNMNNRPVESINKNDGVNFEIPSRTENADVHKVEMSNLNVFDPTQVVLTVPQSAPNVMLISNEVIYNPYTIQHTVNQSCTGFDNNSYLALNQNPSNVTLFGSPPYPVIIDGAVSVPIIQSVPTNITVVPNITLNTLSAPVDRKPDEPDYVNCEKLENPTYVNNEVLNINLNTDHQVISQTSTSTNAEIEGSSQEVNRSIDESLEKTITEQPANFFNGNQSPSSPSINLNEDFGNTYPHRISETNNSVSNEIENKHSTIPESNTYETLPNEYTEQHIRECTIITDQKRLQLKRNQILNRKINYRCDTPIPLTYEPIKIANLELQQKVIICEHRSDIVEVANNSESIESKLAKTKETHDVVQTSNVENSLETCDNIISNAKNDKFEEPVNKIPHNSTDHNSTCRRILLRSSNNLTNTKVESVSNLKISKISKKGKLVRKGIRPDSLKLGPKKISKIKNIQSPNLIPLSPVPSKDVENQGAKSDNHNVGYVHIEDQIPPAVIQNSGNNIIEKPNMPNDQINNSKHNDLLKTSTNDKDSVSHSREEPKDNNLSNTNVDDSIKNSTIIDRNLKSVGEPNAPISTNISNCYTKVRDDSINEIDKDKSVKQNTLKTNIDKVRKSNFLRFEDKIMFDELPNNSNDPLIKCVRVKLPNGNSFKVTISGKLNVEMDDIFEEPTIKAMILKNINNNKKCTLNVKQVKVKSQTKASTVTHVQDVSHMKYAEQETETIDLVSDDEDSNLETFQTEFGIYNCACIDKNIFLKHQEKLLQQCTVKLVNCKILQDISNSNLSENMIPTEKESQACDEDCIIIDDITNSSEDVNKIVDKHDYCKVENEDNNENIGLIKNVDALEDSLSDLSTKVTNDNNINTSKDSEIENNTCKTPRKLQTISKECVLRIDRCDNLIEKLKIQRNQCFVNLVRCDNVFKNQSNVNYSNIETSARTNGNAETEYISVQEPSLQEASLQETSAPETTLKDKPTQVFVEEMTLQNSSVQKISLQEASVHERTVEETSLQETLVKEASIQEICTKEASVQELFLQEALRPATSVQKASALEITAQETPILGTSIQEMCLHKVSVQKALLPGTSLQEPLVPGISLQEVLVPETSIQEAPVYETNVQETSLQKTPLMKASTHEVSVHEINSQIQETYVQKTQLPEKTSKMSSMEEPPLHSESLQETQTETWQRFESLPIVIDFLTIDENRSERSSPSIMENFELPITLYNESNCNSFKHYSIPDFECCAEWFMTKLILADKRYVNDKFLSNSLPFTTPCESKFDDKSTDCESDIESNISTDSVFVEENDERRFKVQVPSLSKITANYFAINTEVIGNLIAAKRHSKIKSYASTLKRKIVDTLDMQSHKISKIDKHPGLPNSCKISENEVQNKTIICSNVSNKTSLKDIDAVESDILLSNESNIHKNDNFRECTITKANNLSSPQILKEYNKCDIKSNDNEPSELKSEPSQPVENSCKLYSCYEIMNTVNINNRFDDNKVHSTTDSVLNNIELGKNNQLLDSPDQNWNHTSNILSDITPLFGSKRNEVCKSTSEIHLKSTENNSMSTLIGLVESTNEKIVLQNKTNEILVSDQKNQFTIATNKVIDKNINVSDKIDLIVAEDKIEDKNISLSQLSSQFKESQVKNNKIMSHIANSISAINELHICKESNAVVNKSMINAIHERETNRKEFGDNNFSNDKRQNTLEMKDLEKIYVHEDKKSPCGIEDEQKNYEEQPTCDQSVVSNIKILNNNDNLCNTENTENISNESQNHSQYTTSNNNNKQQNVTLVYKGDSRVVLNGSIYEDPVIGTCYVFPILNRVTITDDVNMHEDASVGVVDTEMDKVFNIHNKVENVIDLESFNLNVIVPKNTYAKKKIHADLTVHTRMTRTNLKRKIVDYDSQSNKKKYRKSKNIDYPKFTVCTMSETAYGKEYKNLFNYWSSIKFSFSRPFHKDCIDVSDTLKCWPILKVHTDEETKNEYKHLLFIDNDEKKKSFDPFRQTLAEEISSQYVEPQLTNDQINETNFSMGFGEGSDRVIQNSEDGDKFSKFSAATLSDVKQCQPFLLSDNYNKCNELHESNVKQMETCNRFFSYITLRDKVRSFFKKSTLDLRYNCLLENSDKKKYLDLDSNRLYPYDIFSTDFIEPATFETIVNVVQVGQQLPVSTAAQNPVTCDPRVTQVTDASPQCSAENSPHENLQSPVKTEYTELTTADISVPLPQEYERQTELQESSKVPTHNENIPVEIVVSSEGKSNIHERLSQTENDQNGNETDNLHVLVNKHIKNIEYSFDSNENTTSEEVQSNSEVSYDSIDKNEAETTRTEQKQQNGSVEKTDQIAHAMSAAGITPSPEPVIDSEAHSSADIFSPKICQDTTSTPNNFTKTSSINAMMLQQALAQILPPPLNQTNSQESNQVGSNSTVGSQVLHIVQGKNANVNQITVVENTQNSVISNSNTPVLHIVQNKNPNNNTNNVQHATSYSGLSLVDTGLQQGNNQLLHIVNTGNQKNNTGQILKRVNLLTNLANVQGATEQKMVQFVCKSADGKSIHLNAPHQRSMVLRLQPFETPNVQSNLKTPEGQDLTSTGNNSNTTNKESMNGQHEIKSRSVYEENYAKFIQNSNSKTGPEKSTSLPKFNQAFGKQIFQDGNQKPSDINTNNSHLSSMNSDPENSDCQSNDNNLNMEHISQINSPPLLLRKSPAPTTQAQSNIVQQIKQTIAPMMHGGVIYTRQIPVNIGGGQTINLITVPSTELVDDSNQKQQGDMKFISQNEVESPVIKIIPQNQNNQNSQNNEMASDESNNNHTTSTNENAPNFPPQHQPVLTQMRIKLPMLSKAPQMVSGARVVRPSFFQIQRNVIGGANQPVYQQLVLTAAPPLGQHTIRLPQTHTRQVKVASEGQSSSESQMSSSTLEQLREFDMVLEQVKERSTVQPNTNNNFCKLHTTSSDTTESSTTVTSTVTESTQQILYSIGTNQSLNVAYVNRKPTTTTAYVRSPDSSNAIDSPSSSTHSQIPHTATSESTSSEVSPQQNQPKAAKIGSKSKSRPKSTPHPPSSLKINTVPPKTSTQKPLEDEQTTQRILYILAEYKEQVENSPDKDKPAPRRRSNPPSNPSGSSKRKKSSSSSRRPGARDLSPVQGDDTCRTMGSEDSSCGTSQGDCTENCLEPHSPQDSPRKVVRKLTFENETPATTPPRQQPPRNMIVADGQTITVSRGTSGKPTTAVLMPANYILPVSMVKGGQQIAIVTNRGPKLLTVGGETGNALLLQRLIGPAGLKPVLTRPGVRHVRLPTAALHNLQAFNLTAATTVHQPESAASPAPAQTPPELIDSRASTSPWADRESQDVKPERASSPEGSEPWHLTADPNDYSYEETVRTENMDRTVLVVHKREGHRQHRLAHVSAAALRHKYAILEHELRLQKSLSEECEDLGVDSPSASELFPEAELLFSSSPAHDAQQHSHTPQPTILNQSGIPQPDIDDQIATDHLLQSDIDDQQDLGVTLGLDEGIVTVSEDGMQATIALDQEEFARSHPNTTFHSEPSEETEVQPFTITGLKGRHITSTIFHAGRAPATVLVTAPQTTVISQANQENVQHSVKYANIDHIINSSHGNLNLTKFDNILTDSRELHLSHTASAIVHSTGNATQVIRRVCYEDERRDGRYLMDESDGLIAGDDAKMVAEDSSREATLESMADGDEDNSSPERHAELFWESNSASERSERGRHVDYNYSSDSEKCCKSPFDETNSTDSSGVGTNMRLDSVIKEARLIERAGSGSSDDHPPLRTYPAKRMYHHSDDVERSLSGKTRAGFQEDRDYRTDSSEVRRRSSVRGVVKRGCHCCNGSPVPPRPKKPKKKPTIDFTN